jgi:hypothetical protein
VPVTTGNLSQGGLTPPPDIAPPSAQVETGTAANTMNQGAQMGPQYFGGRAGAVAFEADKLLRGWMAGKFLSEQKQREKAANTIGTLNDAVQQSGAAYRAAVEDGDPKKIEAAGKVLQQQWDEYNSAREKYVIPEDMGQKKSTGEKIKGGLKKAFVPQGPQLYAKAAIDISKQTDPRQLFGPSKEEKSKQELADLQKQSAKLSIEEQTTMNAARDEYKKAIATGDATKIEKARQNLEVWGVKVEPPSDAELRQLKTQLDKEVTQSALTGMQAVKSGKSIEQLPEDQQGALVKLGIAPQAKNALQAYLKQVGPGKQFKDDYAATKQYMLDERTTHIMGEKPTPLEELRTSSRIILQHDMQDPEKAKKAGIQPLKPGQEPPRWLVEQEAEKRYKHLKDDTEDTTIYKDTARNKILNKALSGFSPVEQEQIKKTFLNQDENLGLLDFNQNPSLQGMDPKQAVDLYQKFRERSSNWAQQLYPNASSEKINEIFGPVPESLRAPLPTGLTTRRGGYSGSMEPPPSASTMSPPPAAPSAGMSAPPSQGLTVPPDTPKSYPSQGSYVIKTKGGQTLHGGDPVPLTAEEAKKVADSGYELLIQE